MADLVLKNVNKTFGAHAVIPSIDLDIKDGEFVVFVGPSGCGKSTLLRLIAGLEDISSGEILIDGQNVAQTPAADRGVAMVFQSYALYPHMTVRQNLSFGLENIKMPKAEIAARVEAASKLLQIDQLLDRQPRQLSGGQRQRVAIGRAITRDPKIFLFDEPLSNLDAELRVHMRLEITRLHERLGNTMIYVTHDQIEAMTMADKIVVLRKGVVEQVGAPLELYNRPRNTFVAGFIGSPRMNMIDGAFQAGDGTFRFDAAGLPPVELSHEGAEVARQSGKLGIRPEDLVIGDSGWPVEITVAEQHGANSYLHGTLANGEAILIHKPGQIAVTRGDILHVTPAARKWHVFDQSELRIEARPEGARLA